MNGRKVNWFFLTTIMLHIFVVAFLVVFRFQYSLDIISNFAVSSAMIVVPALLFLACSGDNWAAAIGFHRIKWSSVLMIVVFTFLTMPLTTLINAFSMLFVDNVMEEMSPEILQMPFGVMLLFMAFVGPFGEEIVFRGIVYRGYRRSGSMLKAMLLSALLFALGHMNFNQAAYAFAIGLLLVLLVEATGSVWASVIYHVVFNGYNVCIMYAADHFFPESARQAGQELLSGAEYKRALLYSMAGSLLLAAATMAIAVCVLIWIAKNEGRLKRLKLLWTTRGEKKGKLITAPLVIAAAVSLTYMILEAVLIY